MSIRKNRDLATTETTTFTKIAAQTAVELWEFMAENPKTADAILTTFSAGKEVLPAAAGGCIAGAILGPNGCVAGGVAAGRYNS